jgi:hypothetical protein
MLSPIFCGNREAQSSTDAKNFHFGSACPFVTGCPKEYHREDNTSTLSPSRLAGLELILKLHNGQVFDKSNVRRKEW